MSSEEERRANHSDTITNLAIDMAAIKGQNTLLIENGRKVDIALNMISETLQQVASEKIRVDGHSAEIKEIKDSVKDSIEDRLERSREDRSNSIKRGVYLFSASIAAATFLFGYLYVLMGACEDRGVRADNILSRDIRENKASTDLRFKLDIDEHKKFVLKRP